MLHTCIWTMEITPSKLVDICAIHIRQHLSNVTDFVRMKGTLCDTDLDSIRSYVFRNDPERDPRDTQYTAVLYIDISHPEAIYEMRLCHDFNPEDYPDGLLQVTKNPLLIIHLHKKRAYCLVWFSNDGYIMNFTKYINRVPVIGVSYKNGHICRIQTLDPCSDIDTLKTYYSNGVLDYESSYRHGLPYGVVRHHLPNGQPLIDYYYVDGQPSGSYKEWHNNGQIKYEGQYREGKRTGLWRHWDANGNLEKEETFED